MRHRRTRILRLVRAASCHSSTSTNEDSSTLSCSSYRASHSRPASLLSSTSDPTGLNLNGNNASTSNGHRQEKPLPHLHYDHPAVVPTSNIGMESDGEMLTSSSSTGEVRSIDKRPSLASAQRRVRRRRRGRRLYDHDFLFLLALL